MQTTNFNRSLRTVLMAGAVAATTAGAFTAPALADDDWHGHGGWGDHDYAWHGDRDDWGRRPVYGYAYAYPYGYAYPYAYAAPAPAYVTPPSVGFYFGIR